MKSASDSKRRSDRVGDEPRPIRILLVSPTYNGITGADRDWMNLANSLEPAQFQIVWAGQRSCRKLRPYLNPAVVIDLIDLDFHRFTYLIQTEAYQTRSAWLWTKILADHFFRGLEPVRKLHSRCGAHEFDLVISNSAVVTLGFLYAAFLRCPHIWFVKECLDVSIPECRRLADFIQHNSAAVVVPSRAAARSFSQPVTVIGDGNDLSAVDGRRGRRPLQETCANRVATANLPLVVQIGGGSGWKGQHVMANAFVRLSQQIDEPVFSLLFWAH